MNKFDYNYHSHTYRCGHAVGKDEEYILTAIEAGFKEYGVSDHIFLPNITHTNMRGDTTMLDGYIKSFKDLKDKYKDKINIKIGFEAEYLLEYIEYYKSLLSSKKIEYLILGQHCFYENGEACWYFDLPPKEGLLKYTDDVVRGIESGLFTYIAHPDFFSIFYNDWDDLAISCSQRIIDASIKYNVPLEVNLCKVRAHKYGYIQKVYDAMYPYIPFWKLVAKSKACVIVGVDTHNPKHNIMSDIEYVDELVKKTNIKVIFNYRF